MATQTRLFGCHGTLTAAQMENGLALTTRCFMDGGCRYEESPTKSLKRQREEPLKVTRMIHSLPYRPMNAGKRPDALVEGLFGSISAMELDEPNTSFSTSTPPMGITRQKSTFEKSTFHFTVKMPNGIESQYLTTASGEKRLIFDMESSNSICTERESESDEDDRPKKRACTTSNHHGHSLPERYMLWLGSGQNGPAPAPTSHEAIDLNTRRTGGYTRALQPQGPWDNDESNEFMHPCLPNVTYILQAGENQYEIEDEMIRYYGFTI